MGPRPRRHTPRPPPPLLASLHERNIAPAGHSTAWLTSSVKEISPLLAQNGQNTAFFGVPGRRIFHRIPQHLTQGRFFFHPSPIPPPGGTKLALLDPISAQAGKNSPSTAKTAQNQRFFACRANFFSVSPRIHSCWASFSRRWVPQPPHSTCRPPRLKPITPMRVDHCHEMKPLTPLLAQNSQIPAIFRPQRCHGFHAPLAEHPQRRCRFHPRQTLRPQPKPRVVCAHATMPVAHWPHD